MACTVLANQHLRSIEERSRIKYNFEALYPISYMIHVCVQYKSRGVIQCFLKFLKVEALVTFNDSSQKTIITYKLLEHFKIV